MLLLGEIFRVTTMRDVDVRKDFMLGEKIQSHVTENAWIFEGFSKDDFSRMLEDILKLSDGLWNDMGVTITEACDIGWERMQILLDKAKNSC